jgi:hypothetical protein
MEEVGTMLMVFRGKAKKTAGGLTKSDLFQDVDGRVKSRKQAKAGKANPALAMWREAVMKAGGLKDGKFKLIKKGSTVYKKAKKIYEAKKSA